MTITSLTQWLIDAQHLGALGLVLLLMLESLPVIGLFIPGVFVMVALGSASGAGYIPFWDCVFFSSTGALLGDSAGYWLGLFGGANRLWGASLSRTSKSRRQAQELIKKRGRLAVFLGRFVWFFHPAVPVIAGISGIRPGWFYAADIPAVLLWVLVYAGLGHLATGALLQETLLFFGLLGVLLGVFLLLLLSRYYRYRHRP